MDSLIRHVNPSDFPAVIRLFTQLWPGKELHEKELSEVFLRGIASANDEYFCAEVNSEVIGFCATAYVNNFWQEGRISYVYAMIVDEKYRSLGIGRTLLDKATDAACDKGCKRLELDSAFHREQAHKFYEKLGFDKRAFLFSKELDTSLL